jgi:pimeloyl-ACP methyl ester carboxylesterase
MWGEGDVALAEGQMINSRNHASAPFRYERVTGGTHWLQFEAPETVTHLLLDFLADAAHPTEPTEGSLR